MPFLRSLVVCDDRNGRGSSITVEEYLKEKDLLEKNAKKQKLDDHENRFTGAILCDDFHTVISEGQQRSGQMDGVRDLVSAFAIPLFGMFCDQKGRKKTMNMALLGLLGYLLGLLSLSFTPSPNELIVMKTGYYDQRIDKDDEYGNMILDDLGISRQEFSRILSEVEFNKPFLTKVPVVGSIFHNIYLFLATLGRGDTWISKFILTSSVTVFGIFNCFEIVFMAMLVDVTQPGRERALTLAVYNMITLFWQFFANLLVSTVILERDDFIDYGAIWALLVLSTAMILWLINDKKPESGGGGSRGGGGGAHAIDSPGLASYTDAGTSTKKRHEKSFQLDGYMPNPDSNGPIHRANSGRSETPSAALAQAANEISGMRQRGRSAFFLPETLSTLNRQSAIRASIGGGSGLPIQNKGVDSKTNPFGTESRWSLGDNQFGEDLVMNNSPNIPRNPKKPRSFKPPDVKVTLNTIVKGVRYLIQMKNTYKKVLKENVFLRYYIVRQFCNFLWLGTHEIMPSFSMCVWGWHAGDYEYYFSFITISIFLGYIITPYVISNDEVKDTNKKNNPRNKQIEQSNQHNQQHLQSPAQYGNQNAAAYDTYGVRPRTSSGGNIECSDAVGLLGTQDNTQSKMGLTSGGPSTKTTAQQDADDKYFMKLLTIGAVCNFCLEGSYVTVLPYSAKYAILIMCGRSALSWYFVMFFVCFINVFEKF